VPLVSVITPLFNEEILLPLLAGRLAKIFERPGFRWQWVAVDDGSSDGSMEILQEIRPSMPQLKIVSLARNFGQQAAYKAGLDQAEGDAVIFLDADMQDPPELIPDLIEKWIGGAQLVVGVRKSRQERGLRGLLFHLFHEIFFRMTRGAMPKQSGTFCLMDQVVVRHLRAIPEQNLFLPALRGWFGYRQDFIHYDRQAREGVPRQTYAKLFQYAWSGITSFSDLPLKFISLAGLIISFLGFGYAFVLILIKIGQAFGRFQNLEVKGFTTLAVAIFCLGGVQLICLGILGEYLAKIYREVKGRPHYVIRRIFDSSDR